MAASPPLPQHPALSSSFLSSLLVRMRTHAALLFLIFFSSTVRSIVADIVVRGSSSRRTNLGYDITKELQKAWQTACMSPKISKIWVPTGKYAIDQVIFSGPCRAPIILQMDGVFNCTKGDPRYFKDQRLGWVNFEKVDRLTLTGTAEFNGMGPPVWKNRLCSGNPNVCVSLRFDYVTNSVVQGVTSRDSKMFHFTVYGCNNLHFYNIRMIADGDSPNTDGIHIARSTRIVVQNPFVSTGDDCISIGDGSSEIVINGLLGLFCHGISIGSLGKYQDEKEVRGVTVTNCHLIGTQNGVRVKTITGSSVRTQVSNVVFKNIIMDNVQNPLNIDQDYCAGGACHGKAPSKVRIANVAFDNIRGTSATEVAVKLDCSTNTPCTNIHFGYINLKYVGKTASAATSKCSNAVSSYFYSKQSPAIHCS